MTHLSIRDLQKISSETISSLEGPTPVKSGDRTIALLIPLKKGDPAKMAAALKRAEQLAKERDPEEDRKILAEFGDVDPVNWSIEEVRRFKEEEFGRVSRSAKLPPDRAPSGAPIPHSANVRPKAHGPSGRAVRESARPFVTRKRGKPKKTGR